VKVLKLLENLYLELKTYNEIASNKQARLFSAKSSKTDKDGKRKRLSTQIINGRLLYPGWNAVGIITETPSGRFRRHSFYADDSLLKELEKFMREARDKKVFGNFYIEDSAIKSYKILDAVQGGEVASGRKSGGIA